MLGPSGEKPVEESDERIGEPFTEYEVSKTQAEALCREYCNKYNMHIVIVNPPRVYGPGIITESNAVTRLVKLYMAGKWKIMPGDGKRTGSYVYIDDVVNGHILAMQKGRSGERYTLGGENASYIEFFNLLATLTGKKINLNKIAGVGNDDCRKCFTTLYKYYWQTTAAHATMDKKILLRLEHEQRKSAR